MLAGFAIGEYLAIKITVLSVFLSYELQQSWKEKQQNPLSPYQELGFFFKLNIGPSLFLRLVDLAYRHVWLNRNRNWISWMQSMYYSFIQSIHSFMFDHF